MPETPNVSTATESPMDFAVLFGSYLENYGDHHEWCSAPETGNCACGYAAAVDEVRRFHSLPQLSNDEYEQAVTYWRAKGGR